MEVRDTFFWFLSLFIENFEKINWKIVRLKFENNFQLYPPINNVKKIKIR